MLRTYTHYVPITTFKTGWVNHETQCCIAARIFKENSAPFLTSSSLHQSRWWRSSYADARPTNVSNIYQCVGCNSFNLQLQVRCFQIVKFLYFFVIKIVLNFNINAIPIMRNKLQIMWDLTFNSMYKLIIFIRISVCFRYSCHS